MHWGSCVIHVESTVTETNTVFHYMNIKICPHCRVLIYTGKSVLRTAILHHKMNCCSYIGTLCSKMCSKEMQTYNFFISCKTGFISFNPMMSWILCQRFFLPANIIVEASKWKYSHTEGWHGGIYVLACNSGALPNVPSEGFIADLNPWKYQRLNSNEVLGPLQFTWVDLGV